MRIDSNNVNGNYGIYTRRTNQTQRDNEKQEIQSQPKQVNTQQANPNDVLAGLAAFGNYNIPVIRTKITSFANQHQTSTNRIGENTQLIESLYDELASMGLSDGAINIVFSAYFA